MFRPCNRCNLTCWQTCLVYLSNYWSYIVFANIGEAEEEKNFSQCGRLGPSIGPSVWKQWPLWWPSFLMSIKLTDVSLWAVSLNKQQRSLCNPTLGNSPSLSSSGVRWRRDICECDKEIRWELLGRSGEIVVTEVWTLQNVWWQNYHWNSRCFADHFTYWCEYWY